MSNCRINCNMHHREWISSSNEVVRAIFATFCETCSAGTNNRNVILCFHPSTSSIAPHPLSYASRDRIDIYKFEVQLLHYVFRNLSFAKTSHPLLSPQSVWANFRWATCQNVYTGPVACSTQSILGVCKISRKGCSPKTLPQGLQSRGSEVWERRS